MFISLVNFGQSSLEEIKDVRQQMTILRTYLKSEVFQVKQNYCSVKYEVDRRIRNENRKNGVLYLVIF